MRSSLFLLVATSLLVGCAGGHSPAAPPTAADAAAFLKEVDARMLALGSDLSQAGWVQQNFITDDTEALNAKATKTFIEASRDSRRKRPGSTGWTCRPISGASSNLLKLSLVLVTPRTRRKPRS